MSAGQSENAPLQVLVLEDDYLLATDLKRALEGAGAVVMGPFPDEADAEKALAGDKPDCAFIDINLGRGPSFDVARLLAARDIPFAFLTGYDAHVIPAELAAAPRIEKPAESRIIVQTLRQLSKG